jgi:hypothetical protein
VVDRFERAHRDLTENERDGVLGRLEPLLMLNERVDVVDGGDTRVTVGVTTVRGADTGVEYERDGAYAGAGVGTVV